ncbi:MAG: hypothetical protein FWD14_01145 [Treponema sp.]|nr:hypothetical protein [Treponema sp.]
MSVFAAVAAIIGSVIAAGVGIAGISSSNRVARQNLDFQQSTFDYMQDMQRETWNREDTSIARRVQDLEAAGMSPVLAAGQGAQSSSPVRVEAPQRENNKIDQAELVINALRMKADYSMTMAQKRLLDTERQEIEQRMAHNKEMHPEELARKVMENDYTRKTFTTRVNKAIAELNGMQTENRQRLLEFNLDKEYMNQERLLKLTLMELNLSKGDAELVAKKLLIEAQRHDLNIWKLLGLPTNTTFGSSLTDQGMKLGLRRSNSEGGKSSTYQNTTKGRNRLFDLFGSHH